MIDHYWTVLCSNSAIDKDSNNISLFNIVERITIYGEPPQGNKVGAVPIPHTIVTLWGRSDIEQPERGTTRFVIEYQQGDDTKSTDPHEIGIDLTEHPRFRTRATLNALPVLGEGRHWIRVFLNQNDEDEWVRVASIPYEIFFRPESEAAEG